MSACIDVRMYRAVWMQSCSMTWAYIPICTFAWNGMVGTYDFGKGIRLYAFLFFSFIITVIALEALPE